MCLDLPCGYSRSTLTVVVAYCEMALNFVAISIWMIFATVLEARPDLLRDVAAEKPNENQEILVLLDLPIAVQTCFILWILVNLITGLVLSVVLLHGAQERNLGKVRVWFIFTIISYILWLPIVFVWAVHSVEPINIICFTIINYVFGMLCICIVYSFMEDLRIENIKHRPGYKKRLAFDKI